MLIIIVSIIAGYPTNSVAVHKHLSDLSSKLLDSECDYAQKSFILQLIQKIADCNAMVIG